MTLEYIIVCEMWEMRYSLLNITIIVPHTSFNLELFLVLSFNHFVYFLKLILGQTFDVGLSHCCKILRSSVVAGAKVVVI